MYWTYDLHEGFELNCVLCFYHFCDYKWWKQCNLDKNVRILRTWWSPIILIVFRIHTAIAYVAWGRERQVRWGADNRVTWWGPNKMAAIWQTAFSKPFFFNENVSILIQISLNFVTNSPVDKSSLIQVMVWCLFGTKPLPEPMLTKSYNAIWHHYMGVYSVAPGGNGAIFKHMYWNENIWIDFSKIFLKIFIKSK